MLSTDLIVLHLLCLNVGRSFVDSKNSTSTVCSTKVLCPQNLFLRKLQRYKGRMSKPALSVDTIDKIKVSISSKSGHISTYFIYSISVGPM